MFIFKDWKVSQSVIKYPSDSGLIEQRHNTASEAKTLSNISLFSVIPKKKPAGSFGKSGRYFLVTFIPTSTESDGDLSFSNDPTFNDSASNANLKGLCRS